MHASDIVGIFCLLITPTALAQSQAYLAESQSRTQTYHITENFGGCDFYNTWTWETFDDPTHGRVNYVDLPTAIQRNLSFASNDKFIMRADYFNVVQAGDRGRDSIRITSHASYDEMVSVLDLTHMPQGCATWPAWWTLSASGPWPRGGEIDIIEGVNMNYQNLASVHASPECSMPLERLQTGKTVSTDCNSLVNYNQGCGTSFSRPNSYGSDFNANLGGWYVMQKSKSQGVKVWFWSRNDPAVPEAVRDGLPTVSPNSGWGMPDASFPCDSCNCDSHFDHHQMVFDVTFCGDWAGSAFSSSGCGPGSCMDFVDNNPAAFSEAYWEINSLRIYT